MNKAREQLEGIMRPAEYTGGQQTAGRSVWPFPPPTGPVPWTAKQKKEYELKQHQQLPEAPL